MARRIFFPLGVLILLAYTAPCAARQGLECYDFLQLSAAEQRRYLEGYTLGAAMELAYFMNNILNSHVREALQKPADDTSTQLRFFRGTTLKGIEYLEEKYALIRIAGAYPEAFHEAVQRECGTPGMSGAGMFDALPSTLEKMKQTGKYPMFGM